MARGLAEIVAEHGLSELILDTKEVTLTVRRGVTGSVATMQQVPMQMQMQPMPMQMGMQSLPAAVAAAAAAPIPVDDKSHVVTSPFVGTFYRKPNPDSPSYVAMNEKVDKGQVLCIVEAMKLMNEIEADVAGTIVGILVEDGQSVEYGQALFKIL
ncbi:MAG: acetyl-CoA carboxylase biotin carboxyl carrier protein [Deltaproteobacteria bacterium]|nr:acetyl-CoA carboxylase biotin carboxyl carrier protein [Deltaproteobacteria bacterium]